MGTRLVERLSYPQLEEISAIVADNGSQKLTLDRLLRRLNNSDPRLIARVVETGTGCALVG